MFGFGKDLPGDGEIETRHFQVEGCGNPVHTSIALQLSQPEFALLTESLEMLTKSMPSSWLHENMPAMTLVSYKMMEGLLKAVEDPESHVRMPDSDRDELRNLLHMIRTEHPFISKVIDLLDSEQGKYEASQEGIAGPAQDASDPRGE